MLSHLQVSTALNWQIQDEKAGSMMCSKFLNWPTRERAVLTGEETGGENDVPHPTLASDLPVEAAGHVARDAASQGIQDGR